MFWADRIAGEIEERFGTSSPSPLVVRDEKTLSGRVHVGSMRGVAIHGVVSEALLKKEVPHVFKYEFNDFDVFDTIPGYLSTEKFEKYLGMLLMDVPSPEPEFANFAHYYGNEFREVIEESGFHPEFYWGSEIYLAGQMDGVLREAIEHASAIRKIYKEVSGGERSDTWLPVNVVCPQCKKVATTEATNFDGETVQVLCRVQKGIYTNGCGFEGRMSPFGGNAKLPWKVEWAAKWKVMRVSVEGGGKDHSTKGGARDVANHIAREVFHYEPPFDIPYEFFLVGGKKMSSSKGRGSSAREVADLLPPKIFRLAMLSKDYNQAFNFDPEGDTIPVLYDLYDRLATGYAVNKEDDYAKLFEYVHLAGDAGRVIDKNVFLPRFSQVTFIAQMPHLNFLEEIEKLKGTTLTEADIVEAQERKTYATRWLETYAPEKFVFRLQPTLPESAKTLSAIQKQALQALHTYLAQQPQMPTGEELHQALHAIKESEHIAPGELFGAIYESFLGKLFGPKAGWFLSVLDRDFVLQRLVEATI